MLKHKQNYAKIISFLYGGEGCHWCPQKNKKKSFAHSICRLDDITTVVVGRFMANHEIDNRLAAGRFSQKINLQNVIIITLLAVTRMRYHSKRYLPTRIIETNPPVYCMTRIVGT